MRDWLGYRTRHRPRAACDCVSSRRREGECTNSGIPFRDRDERRLSSRLRAFATGLRNNHSEAATVPNGGGRGTSADCQPAQGHRVAGDSTAQRLVNALRCANHPKQALPRKRTRALPRTPSCVSTASLRWTSSGGLTSSWVAGALTFRAAPAGQLFHERRPRRRPRCVVPRRAGPVGAAGIEPATSSV